MILVFGKSGQVGSELHILKNTLTLDRSQADLTDPEACNRVIMHHRPIAVINAAAYTIVDDAEKEESLATLINGKAPAAMAKACADTNIPLVHVSTDYVFDGSGTVGWRTFDRANPINAYGRSKLMGERAILASGCVHAILRTSWVFSQHGNNFVKTMLTLAKKHVCLPVVDDQIGGPSCARDIALACVSIAEQLIEDPKKSGIYHYSGKPNVSWCQFANRIFQYSNSKAVAQPIFSSEYPYKAPRPSNSRLNCELTNKVFGIERPCWSEGLGRTLIELGVTDENP